MNEKEQQEILMKAAESYWKADKIERSIKWNNDEDRDSKLAQRDKILLDMFWKLASAPYQKGV